MNKVDFKNKKVAILGLGIEGLSSLKYLVKHGAQVSVLDEKEEDQIDSVILSEAKKLASGFSFGKNYLSNLADFNMISRSPGVRPDLPEILEAKDRGVEVASNMKLFFDHSGAKIIGVTGTKGKGTTTTLIGEMLKKGGYKAFVGGNIGQPPLDFLDDVGSRDWVVLELSSFQLMDMEKSPHIAVVLMVTSEHLDWHKNSKEYVDAKYNIVSHQTEKDLAVINSDYRSSVVFAQHSKAEKVWVSLANEEDPGVFVKDDKIWRWFRGKHEEIINTSEVMLPGRHNLENACAAVATASVVGVSASDIRNVLREFPGLEHRLELVREWEGKSFYNDTFSTTPETAIAALRSFEKPMTVILGGSSKNSDYTELGEEVVNNKHLVNVVLIGETAGEIEKAIKRAGKPKAKLLHGKGDFEEIIKLATQVTPKGGIVLLSPACASFDMFENYKKRGEQFKRIVNSF